MLGVCCKSVLKGVASESDAIIGNITLFHIGSNILSTEGKRGFVNDIMQQKDLIFERPGVAGNVLQTVLSLAHQDKARGCSTNTIVIN